ncbi:hypothetical protein WKK05_08085 [Nostoc sp. UHCC 0302]|uniref:hypothetical protein n=1 Tax=Nostoc sp. UHCC 0302 TaxID=3134896 RepID=UPI00311C9EF3
MANEGSVSTEQLSEGDVTAIFDSFLSHYRPGRKDYYAIAFVDGYFPGDRSCTWLLGGTRQ